MAPGLPQQTVMRDSPIIYFVVSGFSYFILISGREELKAAVENKINPKRNGSEEGLGNLAVITDLPSQSGDLHRAQEWTELVTGPPRVNRGEGKHSSLDGKERGRHLKPVKNALHKPKP